MPLSDLRNFNIGWENNNETHTFEDPFVAVRLFLGECNVIYGDYRGCDKKVKY